MAIETGQIPSEIIHVIEDLSLRVALKDGERELLSRLAIEFTAPEITETPELKDLFLRNYAVGFMTFDFVEGLFDEHLAEPYALLISDESWVTSDVRDISVAELTQWLSDEQEGKNLRAKLEAARQEDRDIAEDLGWSTPLA